jgi:hypothetical protein
MASTLTIDDIRVYLERQQKETLLKLLMEQVSNDEQLYDRLLLRVAQEMTGGPDLAAFQQAIDRAVRTNGYVEYGEASDYAQRIEAVSGSIADLIPEGYGEAARELIEYLLERLEPHINEVDDSDGYLGGVMESLQTLHYEACEAEPPDPLELAAWLFGQEYRSDWTFHGAVARYADLLGTGGLEEYHRLAAIEWNKVKPLGPGETDKEEYGRRARITNIMEALARQSGDLEELVAIKRRNLAHAYSFLTIAQLYLEHGNSDQAVVWAERGLASFRHRGM